MFRMPPSLAFATFGFMSLAGCGAQESAVAQGGAPKPSPRSFSVNTPVERIAADPRGKAVLDHDVPGLMASSSYMLFCDMSLSQIATLSGGRLSQAKLALVQTDLSALPGQTP